MQAARRVHKGPGCLNEYFGDNSTWKSFRLSVLGIYGCISGATFRVQGDLELRVLGSQAC